MEDALAGLLFVALAIAGAYAATRLLACRTTTQAEKVLELRTERTMYVEQDDGIYVVELEATWRVHLTRAASQYEREIARSDN